MTFKEIFAISNKSGLFSMVQQRKDGAVMQALTPSKTREFVPTRNHMFSPLYSISIFTNDGDNKPLLEVMLEMKARLNELPLPDANASGDSLRQYFTQILTTHAADRVYNSDIKKLIKWFQILMEHDLVNPIPEEENANSNA